MVGILKKNVQVTSGANAKGKEWVNMYNPCG
jgi:hypothetical protein